MIKYLYLFLALWCLPYNDANAVQVLAHDGSFQIAAAVKLGRGGNLDVGLTKGGSVIKGVKGSSSGGASGGKIGDTPSSCPNGTYLSGRSCKKCPAGTYSDDGTVCKDCAAGYYNTKAGQSSCSACPKGKYAAGTGNTSCSLCPAGHYSSAEGSATCTACSPGAYQAEAGQSTCNKCEAGTYAAGTGNTSCSNCLAGTYTSIKGKSSCTPCGPGYYQYQAGKTSCIKCGSGSIASGDGATECIDCPAGSIPNTAKTICEACEAGTYNAYSGNSSCTRTSTGYYAAGTGNTAQTACPKGTYQSSTGKGYCDLCPAGKYQDETGKSSCKDCPEGKSSDGGGIACTLSLKIANLSDSEGIFYTSMAAGATRFKETLGTPTSHISCGENEETINCYCNAATENGKEYRTFRHGTNCRKYAQAYHLDPDACEEAYTASQCRARSLSGPYTIRWSDKTREHQLKDVAGYPNMIYYTDTTHYIIGSHGSRGYGEANDDVKFYARFSDSKPIAVNANNVFESTPYGRADVMCTVNEAGTEGYFISAANCDAWRRYVGSGSCTDLGASALNNDHPIHNCRYKWTGNGSVQGTITYTDSLGTWSEATLQKTFTGNAATTAASLNTIAPQTLTCTVTNSTSISCVLDFDYRTYFTLARCKSEGYTYCEGNTVGQSFTFYSTGGAPCRAGTSSNTGWQTDNTLCTLCQAGTYASGTGNTSCTACPSGQTSPKGSTSSSQCVSSSCPAGQYSDSGSAPCTKCSINTYSSSSGATSCKTCPVAQSSYAGSSSCTACSSFMTGCLKCNSPTMCIKCDSGYELNELGTCSVKDNDCSKWISWTCAPGSYAVSTTGNGTGVTGGCKKCPNNHWCPSCSSGCTNSSGECSTQGYTCLQCRQDYVRY